MELFYFRNEPKIGATQFLRTTWLVSASQRLDFQGTSHSIRTVSADECRSLVDRARKRNVFARHSWENNFYIQRIRELEGKTVIEIFAPGAIDDVLPGTRILADRLEKVAFISATLGLQRRKIQQLLAISEHKRRGFELAISPEFKFIRSSERRESEPRGVVVTDAFARRFARCGFSKLAGAHNADLGRRIS